MVTLVLNYFVTDPVHRIKTEIKVYDDIDKALHHIAVLKSQGYDITSCHYGIYKGNLHSTWGQGAPVDISGDYELPVIRLSVTEEIKVAWNQWKRLVNF